MREWYSAAELAGLPGVPGTRRRILDRGRREGWQARQRKGRGGGIEFHFQSLPETTQAALCMRSRPRTQAAGDQLDRESAWNQYARASARRKDVASERVAALDAVLKLVGQGLSVSESISAVAAHGTHSERTLWRWHGQVKDLPRCDWPAYLLPRHDGGPSSARIDPAAWECFKGDYLRLEAPAASACYDRLLRAAKAHGWQVPALRTLKRRIDREVPRPVQILARQGVEALSRSYPAQERDHNWFHALEAVNADGHLFDVFVRWPDGSIARPMLVGWQDIYSGKVLSWRIGETETACAYRLSFGDMVERFGIPEHVYVDNGRGIASKALTGGSPTRFRFKVRPDDPLGILTQLVGQEGIHWTTPYHGQAKPIERAFRDFCEYIAKHPAFAGAWCGNNPMAKPENYASRAIPVEEFVAIVEEEIRAHNARLGRRSRVCAGRSFDAVFEASYAAHPIRKATAEQRRLWLLAAERIHVSKTDGSIALDGNRYWSEALSAHQGTHVIVRFDPDNLHGSVYAYTDAGLYIGAAECIQRAGFGDRQAAREHARQRTRYKKAARAQLEATRKMSALEVAAQLPKQPEPPRPDSQVVELVRPRRAAGGGGLDVELEEHNSNFDAVVRQMHEAQKKSRL